MAANAQRLARAMLPEMSGLFDHLPRSRPPRRLMKVVDVVDYGSRVQLRCKRGHELQVDCVVDDDHRTRPTQYTPSELRRGIPCPTCADQAIAAK